MKLKLITRILCLIMVSIVIMNFDSTTNKGTFGYDVERLQKGIDDIIILKSEESLVAVSPSFQARVFTSSTNGFNGVSRGWINWKLLDTKKHLNSFAYLGGESRFWFGPEFGEYSIFFDPGKPQQSKYMRAPKDLDSVKFKKTTQTNTSVTANGTMTITNTKGTNFHLDIDREISILNTSEINKGLGISVPKELSKVAFSAKTKIKNIGSHAWNKKSGLLSIWELGCNLTASDTKVIIPLQKDADSIISYFSPLTKERLRIKDKVAYFKGDAKHVSKIGISPQYTKNSMGSYSPSLNLLNIVTFTFEDEQLYVNSIPGNSTPYTGDVINIFNGDVNEKKEANWPFYEFESSSAAKELKVGDILQHIQTTYHFEGTTEQLNSIAKQVLGIHLDEIPTF